MATKIVSDLYAEEPTFTLYDDSTNILGDMIPTTRVVASLDFHASVPERGRGTWAEGFKVINIDPNCVDTDSFDEIGAAVDHWRWSTIRPNVNCEDFVGRYLRLYFPNITYAEHRKRNGYSQGDVVNCWIVFDADETTEPPCNIEAIADMVWEEYSSWAVGDVFVCEVGTMRDDGEWVKDDEPPCIAYGYRQVEDFATEALTN